MGRRFISVMAIGNIPTALEDLSVPRGQAQWEAAAEYHSPAENNEVHVCCDMNLDCLNERWLQSDYNLVTLSRLVQNCCNMNNFNQLVKEPTRIQYNKLKYVLNVHAPWVIFQQRKSFCP